MTVEIRRVVTGVGADGKAIVVQDGLAPRTNERPAAKLEGAVIWITDETPTDLSKYTDPTLREEIGIGPPAGGTLMRIVDFLPAPENLDNSEFLKDLGIDDDSQKPSSGHAFMHRTKTLDFALIMSGEIDVGIDDTEVHLVAGNVVVQRGTNHAWVNRGSKPCRIAFFMVDARDYPPPTAKAFPEGA